MGVPVSFGEFDFHITGMLISALPVSRFPCPGFLMDVGSEYSRGLYAVNSRIIETILMRIDIIGSLLYNMEAAMQQKIAFGKTNFLLLAELWSDRR